MTRMKRTARERRETTPARVEDGAERYEGAFARVRLVRAWIAVAAAVVAMLYAYLALLDRLVRWWSSFPSRLAVRRTVVATILLGALGPVRVLAHEPTRSPTNASLIAPTVSTAPSVSIAPQGLERRDVSLCIADCFESTLSYSTPAYVSRDVPRSVTLLYRSGRALPFGKVELDVTDATASTGWTFRLQLRDPSGTFVTFSNGTQAVYFARKSVGATRVAAQFDASTIPTSARVYTAEVTSFDPAGTATGTTPVLLRVLIINDQASVFGAGVDVVGLQRMTFNQPSGVMVTDGTGSASFFYGSCTPSVLCAFTSPGGDFSVLTTGSGAYRRAYPDGTVVTFDASGKQTSATDRFGNTTTVTYGTNYNGVVVPTAITDPTGQSIAFQYHDPTTTGGTAKVGSLRKLVSLGNRESTFGIDASNNLTYWVDVDGQVTHRAEYDPAHRIQDVWDKAGGVWHYGHGYGATLWSLDAPTVGIAGGSSVRPHLDQRDPYASLFFTAYIGGGTTRASALAVPVDSRANITDAAGHVTSFELDYWNQPVTLTDALSRTTTIDRDSIGRPRVITHPTGAIDRFRYSGINVVMTQPAGADSTNYAWSTRSVIPAGSSIAVTITVLDSVWGPRQSWQKFVYATNGAIQSVESRYAQGDPTTFTTTFTTEAYGRVLTATDNAGHIGKAFYNGRFGNRDSTVAPGGQYTKTIFDALGRDSLTWMSGRPKPIPYAAGPIVEQTLYDPLNRVVSVGDGMRPPVKFEYGPLFLNKVRDRAGQVFRRDYNALGWVTYEYDPADTTSWSRYVRYEYDVDGQLTKRTNRRGQVINTTYDVLHRPTAVTSPSSSDYFGYSTDGLRTSAWNSLSTDSSYYRANGWLDSVVTLVAGRRFRTSYLPDAYQRLDSVDARMTGGPITFSGRRYLYDPTRNVLNTIRLAGSLGATLTRNNEGMVDGINYLVFNAAYRTRTLNFTTAHQLFRDALPNLNGVTYQTGYGYDSLGRIKEWALTDFPFVVNTFSYDKGDGLGRHLRYQNTTQCPTPDVHYGYNCQSLYASSQNQPYDQALYGYDDADNRVSDARSGRNAASTTLSATTSFTFDPGDRAKTRTGGGVYGPGDDMAPFSGAALTFERDLDGNLTRKVGALTDMRYDWDALGRLTSVMVASTGAVVNYDYNALGQLTRRRTNGVADAHFLWQGDNLLAELDGTAGARIAEYLHWGLDQPLAIVTGPTAMNDAAFFVQDAMGNVKFLFGTAANAPIRAQMQYSDWGTPVTTAGGMAGNRLFFKGMLYEGDSTKLYYARNRWYSPEFGGFMSEDPLSIGGGLNTYAFAGGDPINGSDPYGLRSWFDGANGRAIFGLAASRQSVLGGRVPAPHGGPASVPATQSDPFSWSSELRSIATAELQGCSAAWDGGEVPSRGTTGYLLCFGMQGFGARAPVGQGTSILGAAAGSATGLLVEIEGGIVTVSRGRLQILAEMTRSGDVVTLTGAHIDGAGAGTSGLSEMRQLIVEFGRQQKATEVIVHGAKRTTGLHKGRFPRPYIISIPPSA
jgi:RHS repeat-associated protein